MLTACGRGDWRIIGAHAALDRQKTFQNTLTEPQLLNSGAPIRVGLVLDDQLAPRWIHETIEQLLRAHHTELTLVVFKRGTRARQLPPRSTLFALWRKIDKRLFSKNGNPLALELKTYPVPTITLSSEDGKGERSLQQSDLARLHIYNLDVLVQLGSGHLADEFLDCAKYGVWSFHYGRYTKAEEEVALFWNLNAGHSTYELVLGAATGSPRSDKVLCRHTFARHLFSLEYNLALDCRRRSQILLQRLSDLYRQGWASIVIQEMDGNAGGEQIDCASLNRATVSWLTRSLWRLLTRLYFREQWVLVHGKTGAPADTGKATLSALTIVVPPRGQNYADPFLFEHNGRTYIFFEYFTNDGRGTICCAELYGNGSLGETQQVLARNYHLSYPFVFNWHGNVYLLPETWDNRTVEVYGAVDFPHRWELAGVLLRNVTTVDSTILEHNGKLWLFAAGLAGLGTEFSELSLFFADSLFGHWHPHPKNPVVRDLQSARPAGRLFFQGEVLIRPGQDCSRRYGYAIALNRIDVLSETDYRETPVKTILPDWMPRLCATHTFNQHGGLRVLDGLMITPRWVPAKWSAHWFKNGSRFQSVAVGQPTLPVRREGAHVQSLVCPASGCPPGRD